MIVVPTVPLNLNLKLGDVYYESFIIITCLKPRINYFHDVFLLSSLRFP